MKAIYYDAISGKRVTSRTTADTVSSYIIALDKVKKVKVYGQYADVVDYTLNPMSDSVEVRILIPTYEIVEASEENGDE